MFLTYLIEREQTIAATTEWWAFSAITLFVLWINLRREFCDISFTIRLSKRSPMTWASTCIVMDVSRMMAERVSFIWLQMGTLSFVNYDKMLEFAFCFLVART